MSVRMLIFILLSSPALIYAGQDDNKAQDLDIFEFLAMFDQNDSVYIDSEMDDSKKNVQQNETSTTVTKSKSNE